MVESQRPRPDWRRPTALLALLTLLAPPPLWAAPPETMRSAQIPQSSGMKELERSLGAGAEEAQEPVERARAAARQLQSAIGPSLDELITLLESETPDVDESELGRLVEAINAPASALVFEELPAQGDHVADVLARTFGHHGPEGIHLLPALLRAGRLTPDFRQGVAAEVRAYQTWLEQVADLVEWRERDEGLVGIMLDLPAPGAAAGLPDRQAGAEEAARVAGGRRVVWEIPLGPGAELSGTVVVQVRLPDPTVAALRQAGVDYVDFVGAAAEQVQAGLEALRLGPRDLVVADLETAEALRADGLVLGLAPAVAQQIGLVELRLLVQQAGLEHLSTFLVHFVELDGERGVLSVKTYA